MFSCLGKKIKLDTCQHILLYRSLFDTHKKYTVVSKVIARCFSDAGQRKETLSTQKEKPNLRQAGSPDTKTRNCILVACVLVAMYMYPTIFKPLLGLDSFGKDKSKMLQEAGIDLEAIKSKRFVKNEEYKK